MLKVLTVGEDSRELASERVIQAMFTTIGCRLEPQGRGTRFATAMGDLYSGYLTPTRAPAALRDLQEIEAALRQIPVSDVVWSLSDLRRGDDANEPVNHRATNAFDYFVDIDGRPLISRLRDGVEDCLNRSQVLRVTHPHESRAGVLAGLSMVVLGLAWMILGHTWVPGWVLARRTSTGKVGIPIWTFGMDVGMVGVAFMIVAIFPGVYDWFRRRPAASITVVISAVLGWLVICAVADFLPDVR
jgi:Immunity protein 70